MIGVEVVSGVNVLLDAAFHSTGGTTEVTRSAPWAHNAEGRSSKAETIRTFLIGPLLQVRPANHGFSSAVVCRSAENPKLPGTIQSHCPDRALDERAWKRGAFRNCACFFRVPLASRNHRGTGAFCRSSCRHSPRRSRSHAV